MTEVDLYNLWLINLREVFREWGKSIEKLEELTGIAKNSLYAIFKGTLKASLARLLYINKKMGSLPHCLINIPVNA